LGNPPSVDAFKAALTAAKLAANAAVVLIRAAIDGNPIRGGIRAVLDQYRRPDLPPPDQAEMDRDWLVQWVEALTKVQQEHAGKINSVSFWLRQVVRDPVHLGVITAPTAHELAWEFANQLRLDIKRILFDRGDRDSSPWPNREQCRTHWEAIRHYLKGLANLNFEGLAAALEIESAHAVARFGRPASPDPVTAGEDAKVEIVRRLTEPEATCFSLRPPTRGVGATAPQGNPLHVLIEWLNLFVNALWPNHHAATNTERLRAKDAWRALTGPFWATYRIPAEAIRGLADPALAWLGQHGFSTPEHTTAVENAAECITGLAMHQPCATPSVYANKVEAAPVWENQGQLLRNTQVVLDGLRRLAALCGVAWTWDGRLPRDPPTSAAKPLPNTNATRHPAPKMYMDTGSDSPTPPANSDHELLQRALLGEIELTPEQRRDLLGVDLSEAVPVLHPDEETLVAWAAIEVVGGKFPPGWEELRDGARWWRVPIEGGANKWLPVIEHSMRQLFGGPVSEGRLVGYLNQVHHLSPTEAKNLPLATLAELLKRDATPPMQTPVEASVAKTQVAADAPQPEPAPPEPTAAESPSADGAPSEADTAVTIDLEAQALALLFQHPDWSVSQIADHLHVDRKTPYKWKKFRMAAEKQGKLKPRGPKDRTPRSGHKTRDGQVEAYADEGDDE
jgi:hypothetical protein